MFHQNYSTIENVNEDTHEYSKRKKCKSFRRLWIKYIIIVFIAAVVGCIIGLFIPRNILKSNEFHFNLLSQELQKKVDPNFMINQLQIYSKEIHQAGSERNMGLADIMKNNWNKWGLQSTKILKYNVNKTFINNLDPNIVRIWYNNSIVENLTTVELNGTLPVYHSYSINGSAKGRFVFINYGLIKDLETLDNINISYCGPNVIPIVRLGFSFRTAKVKNLIRMCGKNLPGGILIYPDPWDFAVDLNNASSTPDNTPVYPNSWWLPGDAAVFGDMKMMPGLQNPELPSLDGVFKTIDFSQMQTLIPIQPISYNDARSIFQHMNKVSVPSHWGKCLPTYLESSDDYEIEMKIENKVGVFTMANVIGWIPGSVDKDRYVVVGNHRDAWAMGASDPVSGTVILQQVASILGEAYKKGLFQPYRSVMFASWDGEEEGLLGSTEFTNQFGSDLSERCVAYINMDCPIKGSWSFNGRSTPLMIGPMLETAKRVWINSSHTLFDDWIKKIPSLTNPSEPKVDFLGGGSDHISFAYVLGIPSAYPEYKYNQSLPSMPTYHTRYDNIDMMLRWIDPGLQHHKVVSQFVLDYIIRLSYSPVVPYSIDRLVDLLIIEFPKLKRRIDSISFFNNSNYSSIVGEQINGLSQANVAFTSRILGDRNLLKDYFKLRKINDILLNLPRMFLTREGLPTRPYLRNILISTRLQNSYLGSVFTGVYDSLDLFQERKVDLTVVLRQMSLLSDCLRKATDLINGGLITIFD